MPIESFFHEVAFNQMNAGRGQFIPKEPWWRRALRLVSPRVRRMVVLCVALASVVAAVVFHTQLSAFLRSQPRHHPGAADTLTQVAHRSSPAEKVYRRAIACAREEDAGSCLDVLQELLTLTDKATVAKCLDIPMVRALRANEFFDKFARDIQAKGGPPAPPDAVRRALPAL